MIDDLMHQRTSHTYIQLIHRSSNYVVIRTFLNANKSQGILQIKKNEAYL
jgi:hypothetical protein